MKRFLFLICIPVLIWSSTLDANAKQPLKLGVIHLLGVHPDHILLRESFVKALTVKGYDVDITIFDGNSAKYPDTYCQRVTDEAKKMDGAGYDLIYCTAGYHCMSNLNLKTPIVDGVFIAPILLKYAEAKNGQRYCKGNATGNIFGYSFKDVADFARSILPKAKTIAYIRHSTSPISRPVSEIQAEAEKVGLQVLDCPFSTVDDAIAAMEKAASGSEVGFATNDMAALGVEKKLMEIAMDKKYPVIVGVVPIVNLGAIGAIQWDWGRAGEMCADKADKILKGTAANSIPITNSDTVRIGINLKVAEMLKIEIPYEWIEAANLVVE